MLMIPLFSQKHLLKESKLFKRFSRNIVTSLAKLSIPRSQVSSLAQMFPMLINFGCQGYWISLLLENWENIWELGWILVGISHLFTIRFLVPLTPEQLLGNLNYSRKQAVSLFSSLF